MNEQSLTIALPNILRTGDLFSMDVPDRRRWKRLIHWILRKRAPMVRKYFKVTSEVSDSTVMIERYAAD